MALDHSKILIFLKLFKLFDVGPSWLQLRVLCSMLGHLGVILSALGALLGPSWALLGTILGSLGALLGPSWGPLGPTMGPSWPILHRLGLPRGHVGPARLFCELSWALLGPSWGHFGTLWGLFGVNLG